MLFNIFQATLLALAASAPLETLERRDAVAELVPRNPSGVTYSIKQNFLVNSAGPAFAGPFDPQGINFYYQGDGNFVAYLGDASAGQPVWNSGTGGNNVCSDSSQCYLYFTGNGNLLISIANRVVWQTGTTNKGYYVSFNGQAPYVVIYNKSNQAVWKSSNDKPPGNPPPDPCYKGVCP